VQFEQDSSHPILDALPEIVHFPRLKPDDPIWATTTLIDAEMRQMQEQGGIIVDRLTAVLFLQLLNHRLNENKEAAGFLAALRDRRVRHALSLIHAEPQFEWSLSSLGEQVGILR
jgi:hypothetical protein